MIITITIPDQLGQVLEAAAIKNGANTVPAFIRGILLGELKPLFMVKTMETARLAALNEANSKILTIIVS